jgi:NAD(P)-dependent dehydrogenase (short-subunit alcohol dehydrogenase family)
MVAVLHGKTVLVAGGTGAMPAALESGLTGAGATVRMAARNGRGSDLFAAVRDGKAGGIDVLLNVIGPARPIAFLDMSRRDWDNLLPGMLGDAFMCTQAIARAMSLAGEQGTIINIACDSRSPEVFVPPFVEVAWRGAVAIFTKALAAELGGRRIQVNAIVSRLGDRIESPEFEDVVRTALFLCAAHGTFVTGETIEVGGTGVTCW